MGKKKDANTALGRSIIKSHQRKPRSGKQESWHHTSDLEDGYNWNRLNLTSVTDQNSLDEFLTTAELAGTEFTAEKLNIKVVADLSGLPTVEEEVAIHRAQEDNRELLGIPRRPLWDATTSASELEMKERDSFLSWRRGLASLQDKEHVVLTPFERNLEFWRQLWRVIERSDVVVQIVDARNPLLFRCEDLEKYVKEVDGSKENFILMSKGDLLTRQQRDAWAEYFTLQGIRVAFWSAIAETERIKLLTEETELDGGDELADTEDGEEKNVPEIPTDQNLDIETSNAFSRLEQNLDENLHIDEDSQNTDGAKSETESEDALDLNIAGAETARVATPIAHGLDSGPLEGNIDSEANPEHSSKDTAENEARTSDDNNVLGTEDNEGGEKTHDGTDRPAEETEEFNSGRLVTGEELLAILRSVHSGKEVTEEVTTVGMVGYPNVGKSSTINALLQQKKVPVSATPGRTKHFQTLFVEPTLCLCDCPGLVMPSFVSSKAEMVINGILPVDQVRDFVSPISLICQMIPRRALERFYKVNIIKPTEGEDPDRPPSAMEFLNVYAFTRGHTTQKGVPDSRKVSLLVLKDFVNGRLLYRTPPPGVTDEDFHAVDEPEAKEGDDRVNPMVPTITAAGTQERQVSSATLDDAFFHGTSSTVHQKGLAAAQGLRTADGRVVHVGQAGAKQVSGKPWKKHGNINKKEKLRRTYKHLDVK